MLAFPFVNLGVSFVNVRFRFVQVSPSKSILLRFGALSGASIRLPRAREIFTDLACTLVCSNVIAYLRNRPVWQALALPD